jgi:hypothetical protein
VRDVESQGWNFLSDESCGLEHDDDILEPDGPMLALLEDDPAGLMMMPLTGSLVVGRIPTGGCLPTLPSVVPAAHLVAVDIDWPEVLAGDQIGTLRDNGVACDIGAAQTPPPGAP